MAAVDPYNLVLLVAGLAVFAIAVLPHYLAGWPLSVPIALLALGGGRRRGACSGSRCRSRSWPSDSWRGLSGLPLAAAVLLGACMTPTDPVLAAEVEVGPPGHGATEVGGKEEDEVRLRVPGVRAEHAYHSALHDFVEDVERLLMPAVVVLLGGAVVGGLLAPLTWQLVVLAALTLLVVRPAAGLLSLVGRGVGELRERGAIAFFGIRGIGSLYYLSHASVEAEFPRLPELWAVVGLVVVASVLLHGVTAGPATRHLDRRRGEGALRRPAHLADDPLHADADWRA